MSDLVSIVTGTFQRREFLINLKRIVVQQDYPHHMLEWIIIDDSPSSNADLFPEQLDGILVRYYHFKRKVPLAIKRNHLNHQARGKYIVNMDDDDYYPPCRVSYAVEMLRNTGAQIAGNSRMFIYFTCNHRIYQIGPYNDNHGTAATFAYTKEYTQTHDFGEGHFAEEQVFTDSWRSKMAQLDPLKSVLALSHSHNTVDKTVFLEERFGQMGITIHETQLNLSDLITDPEIQSFYAALQYEKQPQLPEITEKMEKTMLETGTRYRTEMVKRMIQQVVRLKQIST